MKDIELGSKLMQKYRLECELASGGMGCLWLATDLELDRRVAIKFIRSLVGFDTQMRVRFEREARSAARIRSPHVIETYEYGVDQGCAFIVLEYLDGEDLRTLLDREKKLTMTRAISIFTQIAKALDAIHKAGVVHRDLKPGNVFITSVEGQETVKILDFGVAKSASGMFQELTQSGMILGTPKYMSPEQLRTPKLVDHRADHWSAAVILYRMLTGACPFNGVHVLEIIDRICRGAFTSAREVAPELPPGIDAFFERAFAPAADHRFASGREMVREIVRATERPTARHFHFSDGKHAATWSRARSQHAFP